MSPLNNPVSTITAPVTLGELKAHLNIDAAFTDDDELLMDCANAAWVAILGDLDKLTSAEGSSAWGDGVGTDNPFGVPDPLRQAVKMLAGHFYASREPVVYGVTPAKVPLTLEYLIAPYRRYGAILQQE